MVRWLRGSSIEPFDGLLGVSTKLKAERRKELEDGAPMTPGISLVEGVG